MPHCFSRVFHVCGLPLFALRTRGEVTTALLFGRIPLGKVRRSLSKVCVHLGPCELFKLRCSGPLPVKIPAFSLPLARHEDGKRRLFYDIGNLGYSESRTGIGRVARSLLAGLVRQELDGCEVVPVYASLREPGFLRASRYLENSFPELGRQGADLPVTFASGDVLLSPIPRPEEVIAQQNVLDTLMRHGVKVIFLLHDMLPLSHPEFFTDSIRLPMETWYPRAARSSGIVAVSQSSMEAFLRWRRASFPDAAEDFFASWFHLGADIENSLPTRGLPAEAEAVFSAMRARPTLLEVSTVEPRKGHAQALAAFEALWARGIDVGFVIVGSAGWKVKELVRKLDSHPELGKRLFWLKGISDEYLDRVYAEASGVLFPSEAEGFGLAVIEGARHGKPLILRDLPVFREIAGEHAAYFSGLEPDVLADVLEHWFEDFRRGAVVPSAGIEPLTWEESTRMLLSRLPL